MVSFSTFIKNNRSGFTLIEVLVTLGIALLLSSILIINGRSGNQTLELKRAAQEIVADMRRTQSYALSTTVGESCQSQGNVAHGWGLEIVHQADLPGEYFVYGNCNAQQGYQTETSDNKLSEVILENVEITVLSPSNISGGPNKPALELIFIPPVPETFIERNNVTSFRIRMTHLDNPYKCIDIQGNDRGNFWINEVPVASGNLC